MTAVQESINKIKGLSDSGELGVQSPVFAVWREDHWIGVLEGESIVKEGRDIEEALEYAKTMFGNMFANGDIIACNVGKYIYLKSDDEIRNKLETFVPQTIRELLT